MHLTKPKTDNNILVVEDDEINSRLINEILSKEKFNVTVVTNGKEAVEIVENNINKFSLIIMDIKMPIMNGYDACLLIKQISDIPVIAHTADVYFNNSDKYKSHSFDEVVFKPVPISNLLRIVHSYSKTEKPFNNYQLN